MPATASDSEVGYRDLFLQLTRALPGVVFQIDLGVQGAVALGYVSASVQRFFGLSPERALERPTELFDRLVRQDGASALELLRAAGLRFETWTDEVRVEPVEPGGAATWLRVVAAPELGPGAVRYTGVFLDITGHKRLEGAVRRAQKLEAVGVLAAGIAHNFNNLLAGILPNLELSLESCPERLRRLLEDARKSTLSAVELVRQLTLLARDGSTKAHEPVSIGKVLERAIGVCEKTFEARVSLKLSPVEPTLGTRGNASQLEQVFLNLLINARDALASINRPVIKVQVELLPAVSEPASGPRMLVVRVTDNGGGMDERTLGRLGEPFFTTKEPGEGTGLGLATAFGIVADHGGRLECQSRVGKGSTFSVSLPHEEVIAAESERPRPLPRHGRGQVLLIDDEPSIRRAYRRILTHAGFSVVTAEDGLAGLDRFAESPASYALVLLDLNMPHVSGEQVLRQMLALRGDVPVIVVTGRAATSEGLGAARAVLQKPVPSERLIREIEAILDH